MISTKAYAAFGPKSNLRPFQFKRRDPGPHDVLIEILYCGICHSDIHQAKNEWGESTYPMVPGHEIAGRVTRVGAKVKRFKVGDPAGVGCFVMTCRECASCKEGLEQFCDRQVVWTYGAIQKGETKPTYGGYSSQIVVDENYVLKIPPAIPLAKAAPLLCAGITTYSPLRHFKVGPGKRIAVAGLGGLGHMAVKIAAKLGAHVTVLSTSKDKEEDARRFGAKDFCFTKNPKYLQAFERRFDFILDTVGAPHDLSDYLGLLKRDGVLCIVGVPEKPAQFEAFSLIGKRRRIAGSLIGGTRETQEMLNFCAKKNISPEIEVIAVQQVNEAFKRTVQGKVRYRFVLDLKTL